MAGLGALRVAEKFDLKAIAVSVTELFAEIDQSIIAAPNCGVFNAFRHQEDLGRGGCGESCETRSVSSSTSWAVATTNLSWKP